MNFATAAADDPLLTERIALFHVRGNALVVSRRGPLLELPISPAAVPLVLSLLIAAAPA
jgi:hypothetical protein